MMLATVSKVEDIGNPLKISLFLAVVPDRAIPRPGAGHPSAVLSRGARIAKSFGNNQWRAFSCVLMLWNVRAPGAALVRFGSGAGIAPVECRVSRS
jgi:hypothetical protein